MDAEHRTKKRGSLGAQLPPIRKEIKGDGEGAYVSSKNVGAPVCINTVDAVKKCDESSDGNDANEGSDCVDTCDGKVGESSESEDKKCVRKSDDEENN